MKKLEDELMLQNIHHLIINVVIMNVNYITYVLQDFIQQRGRGKFPPSQPSGATRSNLRGSKLQTFPGGPYPRPPSSALWKHDQFFPLRNKNPR